jgi:hypothetical protein
VHEIPVRDNGVTTACGVCGTQICADWSTALLHTSLPTGRLEGAPPCSASATPITGAAFGDSV